jgi:hypothetical protein
VHPGHAQGAAGVDAFDAGVRVRRHQHRTVQHVRQLDVVDEARTPG